MFGDLTLPLLTCPRFHIIPIRQSSLDIFLCRFHDYVTLWWRDYVIVKSLLTTSLLSWFGFSNQHDEQNFVNVILLLWMDPKHLKRRSKSWKQWYTILTEIISTNHEMINGGKVPWNYCMWPHARYESTTSPGKYRTASSSLGKLIMHSSEFSRYSCASPTKHT